MPRLGPIADWCIWMIKVLLQGLHHNFQSYLKSEYSHLMKMGSKSLNFLWDLTKLRPSFTLWCKNNYFILQKSFQDRGAFFHVCFSYLLNVFQCVITVWLLLDNREHRIPRSDSSDIFATVNYTCSYSYCHCYFWNMSGTYITTTAGAAQKMQLLHRSNHLVICSSPHCS